MPPRKRKNARAAKAKGADPAITRELQRILDDLDADVRERTEALRAEKAPLVQASREECLRLLLQLPPDVRTSAFADARQEAEEAASRDDAAADGGELAPLLEELSGCLPPEPTAAGLKAAAGGKDRQPAPQTGKRGGKRVARPCETPQADKAPAPPLPPTTGRLARPGEVFFSANGSPLTVLGDSTNVTPAAAAAAAAGLGAAGPLPAHLAGRLAAHADGSPAPPTPGEACVQLKDGRTVAVGRDGAMGHLSQADRAEVRGQLKLMSRLARAYAPEPSRLGK